MRHNITVLSSIAAVLMTGIGANAQVKFVDTIGNGAQWGIGAGRTNGSFIGADPTGDGTFAPKNPANAGYAVLPFTTGSLTGFDAITKQVDIVFNIQPPANGTNSNVTALSGAIVPANPSNSLSATGLTSADFFSFDTSPNKPFLGTPNEGDGLTHVYSAAGLNYALTPNTTYWLVVAPKKGLAAQTNDALNYGILNYRLANDITNSAASLTTAFATVGQGESETQGANPGDTLTGVRLGRGNAPAYFGARISGITVPEPSSAAALFGGVTMAGAFLLRRRRK